MVYLYKNQDSYVVTDNLTKDRLDSYDVFLDDVSLGTFNNVSEDNIYIKLLITADKLDLPEKEYKLKLMNSYITMKEELVYIKNITSNEVKEHSKSTSLKFYEKN